MSDADRVPTAKETRYNLHDIASRVLLDPIFDTQEETDKKKLYLEANGREFYHRVSMCHKVGLIKQREDMTEGVPLVSYEGGGVGFGGLLSCGSVWSCPICSSKISEVRVREIDQAFNLWYDQGQVAGKDHTQIMVTFTIPHYASQSIEDLREFFMKARRAMKEQNELKRNPAFQPFKVLCDQYGIEGFLAAIEVTFGVNGWHPHSHDIFFVNQRLDADQLEILKGRLVTAWIYACERVNGKMTKQQKKNMAKWSINISQSVSAAEYVSKFGQADVDKHKDLLLGGWGPAQELTKSQIKTAGNKGLTPWDMLRNILKTQESSLLSKSQKNDAYLLYGRLFREYSRCFHGKRQLFWSKGFKASLNLESLSDQEISGLDDQAVLEFDPNDPEASLIVQTRKVIGVFDWLTWDKIKKYKLRGKLLSLAETHTFKELMQVVYDADLNFYVKIKEA